MTCTFCGSLLDGTESECPYCGHKVNSNTNYDEAPVTPKKSSPVEEFTSKFSYKPSTKDVDDDYEEEPMPKKSYSSAPREKASMSFPMLVGIGAVALLSLISLILCLSINSKVSDLKQDMLSQLYQIQTTQNDLINNMNSVSSSVGNIGYNIEQSNVSKNIRITKQPTEASTYVGRGSETDNIQNVCIFSIDAEGQGLSFAWQKFDNNTGDWVTIQFDPDNNEGFGLHLYSTPSHSELCAHDLKPAAFGSYRCLVSDATGSNASETVTLTEKAQ